MLEAIFIASTIICLIAFYVLIITPHQRVKGSKPEPFTKEEIDRLFEATERPYSVEESGSKHF